MINVILLGPPAAGKGSVAKLLRKHYNIPQISTGEMFREAIEANTPLGVLAASYINGGNLVPDDVTIQVVEQRLKQPDCEQGFMFDGFPRTIVQADALEIILKKLNRPINAVPNSSVLVRNSFVGLAADASVQSAGRHINLIR